MVATHICRGAELLPALLQLKNVRTMTIYYVQLGQKP